MIDSLLAFALGVLLTPYALLAFVFCSWAFIHEDREIFATICLFVAAVIFVVLVDIPLNFDMIWKVALAYIPIGLIWSIFRWKRYVDKAVYVFNQALKSIPVNDSGRRESTLRESLERKLSVSEQIDSIVGWVLAWPISIIDCVFGDIIVSVKRLIVVHFRSIFDKISENARKNITPRANVDTN